MAQRVRLTLTKGRGILLGNCTFDRFWAHSAPGFAGNRTPAPGPNRTPAPGPNPADGPNTAQTGRKRRPGGLHKPQEAFFRPPMAPGRAARGGTRLHAIRGLPGPLLGQFGAFWAPSSLPRPDPGRSEQENGRRQAPAGSLGPELQRERCSMALHGQTSTPPPGPFVQPYPRYRIPTH